MDTSHQLNCTDGSYATDSLSQRESDEFVSACFQEMLDVFLSDGAGEKQKQGEGWNIDIYQITAYIAQKGQQCEASKNL